MDITKFTLKYTFWIVAIRLLTKSYSLLLQVKRKRFSKVRVVTFISMMVALRCAHACARAFVHAHVRDDYVDMRHLACVLTFNN